MPELLLPESAVEVDPFLHAVLGCEGAELSGVLHIAAVWPSPEGKNVVLRINQETPKSALDFFLLQFGRARASTVLTTGKILREEPDLCYWPPASRASDALRGWRSERNGMAEAGPKLLILTSGRGFDGDQLALRGVDAFAFTSDQAALEAERWSGTGRVTPVGHSRPTVRAAVEYAQSVGLHQITVEAGPSTASQLYQTPCLVDHLILSRFHGSNIPESVVGGELTSDAELERGFAPLAEPYEQREASGWWSFQAYRRQT